MIHTDDILCTCLTQVLIIIRYLVPSMIGKSNLDANSLRKKTVCSSLSSISSHTLRLNTYDRSQVQNQPGASCTCICHAILHTMICMITILKLSVTIGSSLHGQSDRSQVRLQLHEMAHWMPISIVVHTQNIIAAFVHAYALRDLISSKSSNKVRSIYLMMVVVECIVSEVVTQITASNYVGNLVRWDANRKKET